MTGQTDRRRSLWQRISALTQDVPEQDKVCEFDCPHVECTTAKWRTCENRLNPLTQPHETIAIQRSLFNRIAGFWPYFLVAISATGFAYLCWSGSH